MNQPDLAQFSTLLKSRFQLGRLLPLFAGQAQPIVAGGAVRDFLLGKPFNDLDISTRSDPTPAARKFARDVGGTWFWLDQGRGQSRVLLKIGGDNICFDFTPWRRKTLKGDLRCRDYTINAIAVKLSEADDLVLVDPLGGVQDLAAARLRLCSSRAFADDPLRILRGIRLAARLRFKIPNDLLDQMQRYAPALSRCAGERLAQELQLLFAADPQLEHLRQLQESGVFSEFGICLAEDALVDLAAEWTAWRRQTAALVPDQRQRFHDYVTGTDSLIGLLKFARLLERGCRPEQRRTLLARLRSSRSKLRLLERFWEIFAGRLAWPGDWPQSSRAQLRRLEELSPHHEAALLALWLFQRRSAAELKRVDSLLNQAAVKLVDGRLEDLVSGHELLELLDLEPGVAVGRWQQLLRREEYSGRVESRAEALQFLSQSADKVVDKV